MNINIIYVCCLSRMMRKYHVRFLEGVGSRKGTDLNDEKLGYETFIQKKKLRLVNLI